MGKGVLRKLPPPFFPPPPSLCVAPLVACSLLSSPPKGVSGGLQQRLQPRRLRPAARRSQNQHLEPLVLDLLHAVSGRLEHRQPRHLRARRRHAQDADAVARLQLLRVDALPQLLVQVARQRQVQGLPPQQRVLLLRHDAVRRRRRRAACLEGCGARRRVHQRRQAGDGGLAAGGADHGGQVEDGVLLDPVLPALAEQPLRVRAAREAAVRRDAVAELVADVQVLHQVPLRRAVLLAHHDALRRRHRADRRGVARRRRCRLALQGGRRRRHGVVDGSRRARDGLRLLAVLVFVLLRRRRRRRRRLFLLGLIGGHVVAHDHAALVLLDLRGTRGVLARHHLRVHALGRGGVACGRLEPPERQAVGDVDVWRVEDGRHDLEVCARCGGQRSRRRN
eukprot:Rhum_TRINITY_DN11638_c0_g1::Rhum_TRINITY_DN11638_c0_g1_i2::g.45599::m.45599